MSNKKAAFLHHKTIPPTQQTAENLPWRTQFLTQNIDPNRQHQTPTTDKKKTVNPRTHL